MIQEFVEAFDADRNNMVADFQENPPNGYGDLVKRVIQAINPEQEYGGPDFENIHCIDTGDYQGTLLFVIAGVGYQPDDFWVAKVDYGSCSYCDAFQDVAYDTPEDERPEGFFKLALHIFQSLKEV